MQLTPTITFRGVRRTTQLENDILTRVRRLETFYPRITGCRVAVEPVERHHGAGNRYHVRIDLTVPGEEIVIAHEAGLHAAAQDVHLRRLRKAAESDPERRYVRVAIREAFALARRRLQDYAGRQRGSFEPPARRMRGRIDRLFPVDEFGYIEAADGHEVYFQKSSVQNGEFARLAVGSEVSFAEEAGDRGPQASTVRLLHPRRVHRAAHAAAGARAVR
jgi:cold shock CspA family protein